MVLGAGGVAAGWQLADPIVGLLITVAIVVVLREAAREVYRRLMDAVDPALLTRAEQALADVPGVIKVGRLRLRWIGHQLQAEGDLVVPADLTLARAHDVTVAAEQHLTTTIPSYDPSNLPPRPRRPGRTRAPWRPTGRLGAASMSDHGHGHGHGIPTGGGSRRPLIVVLVITTTILLVEVAGAAISGSLALLADAGHMLTDGAGVGLALLAIRFAARPATPQRTFGYYRLEILAAVVNAVLLFGVAAFILVEAWRRLTEPPEVASGLMLVVALVGLAANAVSMWLLHGGQRDSLNLRGAYLEVWGDLLGSVAVLAAAVVIALTGFQAADPIASAVIGLAILPRTWRLLREAVDVLLEAAPKGVDLDEVRRHLVEPQV